MASNTIEEQLTEVYSVIDELHEIETRLGRALDKAIETIHAPEGAPTHDRH